MANLWYHRVMREPTTHSTIVVGRWATPHHRVRLNESELSLLKTALNHELGSKWGEGRKVEIRRLLDRLINMRPGHQ
jgi:hypothetical protein